MCSAALFSPIVLLVHADALPTAALEALQDTANTVVTVHQCPLPAAQSVGWHSAVSVMHRHKVRDARANCLAARSSRPRLCAVQSGKVQTERELLRLERDGTLSCTAPEKAASAFRTQGAQPVATAAALAAPPATAAGSHQVALQQRAARAKVQLPFGPHAEAARGGAPPLFEVNADDPEFASDDEDLDADLDV